MPSSYHYKIIKNIYLFILSFYHFINLFISFIAKFDIANLVNILYL